MDWCWPERIEEATSIVSFVQNRLDNRHNNILYVCGNCGCGKTSTCERLPLNQFNGTRKARFRHVNCADLSSKDVLDRTLSGLQSTNASTSLRSIQSRRERLAELIDGGTGNVDDLTVFVLDEVEAARPQGVTELKRIVDMGLTRGEYSVAFIIISNSKELFGVDPRRIVSITFSPYSQPQLRSIAARWAAQSRVDIAPVALEHIAKTVTAVHQGDVRKLRSCLEASIGSAGSAEPAVKSHRVEPNQKASSSRSGRRTQDAHVSFHAARSAIADTTSVATQICSLPQQMLFLLCCCASTAGIAKAMAASGASVSTHNVHSKYQRAAQRVGLSTPSVAETRTLLQNLADLGLLSGGSRDTFGVCVHRNELAEALREAGPSFDVARTILDTS